MSNHSCAETDVDSSSSSESSSSQSQPEVDTCVSGWLGIDYTHGSDQVYKIGQTGWNKLPDQRVVEKKLVPNDRRWEQHQKAGQFQATLRLNL